MFQFFPLQSSCIPVHFQFDSFTISQLLVKNTLQKKFYKDNYNEEKSNIWNLFFKINKKIKNYIFDNTIITDGYSASIRFIEKNFNEYFKGLLFAPTLNVLLNLLTYVLYKYVGLSAVVSLSTSIFLWAFLLVTSYFVT